MWLQVYVLGVLLCRLPVIETEIKVGVLCGCWRINCTKCKWRKTDEEEGSYRLLTINHISSSLFFWGMHRGFWNAYRLMISSYSEVELWIAAQLLTLYLFFPNVSNCNSIAITHVRNHHIAGINLIFFSIFPETISIFYGGKIYTVLVLKMTKGLSPQG